MSCNAQNMSLIKIKRIIGILKAKKYIIYSQPYQLNMVGVRNKGTNPIKFDDRMYVFWKTDKNKWVGRDYAITTDPSTAWLKNPMNKVATAVLPNGQYVDAWKIGKHKGQYTALVQRKPFCILRVVKYSETIIVLQMNLYQCFKNNNKYMEMRILHIH